MNSPFPWSTDFLQVPWTDGCRDCSNLCSCILELLHTEPFSGPSPVQGGTKRKAFRLLLVLSATCPKARCRAMVEDTAWPLLQAFLGSCAVSSNFLRGAYSMELRVEKLPEKLGKPLSRLKDEGGHNSCFPRLRYSGLIEGGHEAMPSSHC